MVGCFSSFYRKGNPATVPSEDLFTFINPLPEKREALTLFVLLINRNNSSLDALISRIAINYAVSYIASSVTNGRILPPSPRDAIRRSVAITRDYIASIRKRRDGGRREIQGTQDALINEILSLSDTADAELPPLSANYGPI